MGSNTELFTAVFMIISLGMNLLNFGLKRGGEIYSIKISLLALIWSTYSIQLDELLGPSDTIL
jgi:hypothetical protein